MRHITAPVLGLVLLYSGCALFVPLITAAALQSLEMDSQAEAGQPGGTLVVSNPAESL